MSSILSGDYSSLNVTPLTTAGSETVTFTSAAASITSSLACFSFAGAGASADEVGNGDCAWTSRSGPAVWVLFSADVDAPGVYTTDQSGSEGVGPLDTLTITSTSSVPEPSSVGFLLTFIGASVLAVRRRTRTGRADLA